MKKIIVLLTALVIGVGLYARPTDVSEKVKKIFHETFSSARDVQWSEYDNNYAVSFSLSGIQSRVIYDKEGNLVTSMRYYSPENLPMYIYGKLRKKYSDKALYGVTEITNDEMVSYFIKMHDDKYWYTIKADNDGNMEVYEKMKRGDIGIL